MMPDRAALLNKLAIGSIFHAESPNGASLICLVTSITATTIQARTVTTQIQLEFDRETGIAEWGSERVPCTIDSTAPLPAHIYDVLLRIDQKFRFERDPERLKLNDDEKRALIFIGSYYPSNLLT